MTRTISDYDTINKVASNPADYSRALRIGAGWMEDEGKGVSSADRNGNDDAWVFVILD